jgi:hypothetical protein
MQRFDTYRLMTESSRACEGSSVRRICARPAIVAVRARSFRTEVLQDDAGAGGFFQTHPPPTQPSGKAETPKYMV